MANQLYTPAKELFLGGGIDLINDTIKVVLIDAALYTLSAAHEFYDEVSAGAVGTPVTLASKSITGGVFDAADSTFTAVPAGDPLENVIAFKDTGNAATSPVIAYLDTFASGMPVTPNGGNINVQWDNGANKIFKL